MNACNAQPSPEEAALEDLSIVEIAEIAARRNKLRHAALRHISQLGTKEHEEAFHERMKQTVESPDSLAA